MATFSKGILGGFSGKVGNVVGARWRGRNIMRSLPESGNRTPTEKQLEQRKKFAATIKFLNPIRPFVSRFYGSEQGDKSSFNLATSYYLTEALIPDGDNYVVDYPKALISKGELQGLTDHTATAGANQEVTITWSDNSGQGYAHADDWLAAMVYVPVLNLFLQYLGEARRDATTVTLNLPAYTAGMEVQLYATFTTFDETTAATSTYLGALTVS